MITQLVIENFLSFKGRHEINLKPLTVVIGPNNSGKSNLISALKTISLNQIIKDKSEVHQLFGRSLEELVNKNSAKGFNLQLIDDAGRITKVDKESINSVISFQEIKGEMGALQGKVSRIRFFKLSAEMIRMSAPISPIPTLRFDGFGLPGVLDYIRGEYPEVYTKIENDFKRFVPEIERIQLRTVEDGRKVVLLKQTGYKEPFPANEISDGLLLFLALLCCVNMQPAPSMICLDEPDNGIHPRRFRVLLDQLHSLTERAENPVQILMTTHSPYMLDWFKDDLDAVLILDKKDDSTVVTTAQQAVGKEGLMGSPLGELWYSGAIGGVPK